MFRIFFFLSFLLIGEVCIAQETLVFETGQKGHAIYRILAIISLPTETLWLLLRTELMGAMILGT